LPRHKPRRNVIQIPEHLFFKNIQLLTVIDYSFNWIFENMEIAGFLFPGFPLWLSIGKP
jgi:hypothetical protein